MRKALGFILTGGVLLAGCLSSVPRPDVWMVESAAPGAPVEAKPDAFAAVTRQGTVAVNAPFDSVTFTVRRAGGRVAQDAFNVFAAPPAALLRAPVRARLEADGRFGRVVPQTSAAQADVQVDVLVRDLSLDCSGGDGAGRRARAAVSVDVIRLGRGARTVLFAGDGAGEADAASGDYSAAFTAAFDAAMAEALRALRAQPPPQPIEHNNTTKGDRK